MVEIALINQEHPGEKAADQAHAHGIRLEVDKLSEAKKGLFCCRTALVIERGFGWATRFCRLTRDNKRLPETLAELHYLAFAVEIAPAIYRNYELKFITGLVICGPA